MERTLERDRAVLFRTQRGTRVGRRIPAQPVSCGGRRGLSDARGEDEDDDEEEALFARELLRCVFGVLVVFLFAPR